MSLISQILFILSNMRDFVGKINKIRHCPKLSWYLDIWVFLGLNWRFFLVVWVLKFFSAFELITAICFKTIVMWANITFFTGVLGSCVTAFLYAFHLFLLLFLVTRCFIVAVQPCINKHPDDAHLFFGPFKKQ